MGKALIVDIMKVQWFQRHSGKKRLIKRITCWHLNQRNSEKSRFPNKRELFELDKKSFVIFCLVQTFLQPRSHQQHQVRGQDLYNRVFHFFFFFKLWTCWLMNEPESFRTWFGLCSAESIQLFIYSNSENQSKAAQQAVKVVKAVGSSHMWQLRWPIRDASLFLYFFYCFFRLHTASSVFAGRFNWLSRSPTSKGWTHLTARNPSYSFLISTGGWPDGTIEIKSSTASCQFPQTVKRSCGRLGQRPNVHTGRVMHILERIKRTFLNTQMGLLYRTGPWGCVPGVCPFSPHPFIHPSS